MTDQTVTVTGKQVGDSELSLAIGDRIIVGWTEVRVTRGMERMPSDFEISLTDPFPLDPNSFVIQPGDPCKVFLGSDLVVTGYVGGLAPSFDDKSHTVSVSGRGACQDLVDCSAEWPGCQIVGSNVLEVAKRLASPYGIQVNAAPGTDLGPRIHQFNFSLGETPYSLIERVSRFAAVLSYEVPDGGLLISGVSSVSAASGFREGVNILSASAHYSMDQRYSHYLGYAFPVNISEDIGVVNLQAKTEDRNVKRRRLYALVSEYGDYHYDVIKKRTYWEAARRMGRSKCVNIKTDSWRDASGRLYEPNTLVTVDSPSLKLANEVMTICEVTYRFSKQGTECELLCMPPEAFEPQPIVLQPVSPDLIPPI